MKEKVIIVTGGSKGIGAEIVKTLARKKHRVILNYNQSEEKAIQIKKELEEENITIDIVKADLRSREEVKKLVGFTINKYQTIDVLINNAGIDQIKCFLDITERDWQEMMQTNLTSVFYCIQEVLPTLIHNKRGCIINMSSIWGLIGASCETHYAISKAGIDAMTKSLAKELGLSNIRINSIAPGMIDTEMNQNIDEESKKDILEEIPLGKIGKTKDIARCVEWLIKDEYTTGQVISINGGWVIT